jgi:SAM-dependent methyltransferase
MATERDVEAIQEGVRQKYAEVSRNAAGRFAYPTGREGAESLAYDPAHLAAAPEGLFASYCGVGNPFTLGEIQAGEAILDVGCGGGLDLFVASRLVGPAGRVCGIDLTPEMAARARANLEAAGIAHAEVQVATADRIPYPDATFDVVTSNGVLNLAPHKEQCFREIFRVLRPGGRLQLADIVLADGVPAAETCSIDAWSQ